MGYQKKAFDLAILTLTKTLTFRDNVQPLCLPVYAHNKWIGKDPWVAGWGYVGKPGTADFLKPKELRYIQKTVVSIKKCDKKYKDQDLTA